MKYRGRELSVVSCQLSVVSFQISEIQISDFRDTDFRFQRYRLTEGQKRQSYLGFARW